MPKNPDIKKVLVIGSGPIVIGQAAEFDYAGTQACRALKEEGLEVILVNSNPATIMTDNAMADKIYIEPLTLETVKRIIKKDGLIFISYYMNEYAIITHGFRDNNIISSIENNLVNKTYHITPKNNDLYSMVRLEDINRYKNKLNLKRIKILAQDGPSDYLRSIINKMDDKTFSIYLDYHLKTCERKELLGASSHVMDILKK